MGHVAPETSLMMASRNGATQSVKNILTEHYGRSDGDLAGNFQAKPVLDRALKEAINSNHPETAEAIADFKHAQGSSFNGVLETAATGSQDKVSAGRIKLASRKGPSLTCTMMTCLRQISPRLSQAPSRRETSGMPSASSR